MELAAELLRLASTWSVDVHRAMRAAGDAIDAQALERLALTMQRGDGGDRNASALAAARAILGLLSRIDLGDGRGPILSEGAAGGAA